MDSLELARAYEKFCLQKEELRKISLAEVERSLENTDASFAALLAKRGSLNASLLDLELDLDLSEQEREQKRARLELDYERLEQAYQERLKGYIAGKKELAEVVFEQRPSYEDFYNSLSLHPFEGASFANFDLGLFSASEMIKTSGSKPISLRRSMELIQKIIRDNLAKCQLEGIKALSSYIFMGHTGTGKTYLANCIAREIFEQGYHVVIYRAEELIRLFETRKARLRSFRPDILELQDIEASIKALSEADLLVIDDLGIGQEDINSAHDALLFVLNARQQRASIITSNMSLLDISKQYEERILSRLMADKFIRLAFEGSDLRRAKRKVKTSE